MNKIDDDQLEDLTKTVEAAIAKEILDTNDLRKAEEKIDQVTASREPKLRFFKRLA